jgi:hypothetical protein
MTEDEIAPKKRPRRGLGAVAVLILAATAAALGGVVPFDPYAPYAFLIGEWDVSAQVGGPPVAGALFRWGPGRSYIWYVGSLFTGGAQRPHFEGMLLWNGVHRNLDMLLALDLEGGRIQEQGVMSVEFDGTVVREITAFYSEGAQPIGQPVAGPGGVTARFRQTFKSMGRDRILTTVLRESERGWTATFPGSDHLVMTRRSRGKPERSEK